MKRPPSSAAVRKPAAAVESAYEDMENVQPLAPVDRSGGGRRSAVGSAQSLKPAGNSGPLIAILGVGGAVVALLLVILAVVLTRGGGNAGERRPGTLADSGGSAPVDTATAPAAVTTPAVTPTTYAPDAAATDASATSAAAKVIDSAEVVRRLKEATVYIKIMVAGKMLGSGTGFAIETRGDVVRVATNRHVAVVNLGELPRKYVPKGSKAELEVVFRSGQGAQKEQAVPAQIIAADTTDEFSTDLAVLECRGVKQPPKPIDVYAKSDTTEGMTYTGAGFPLGGMLNAATETRGNPSVTITGGRIAALRRDESGQVALFQVDGSIQPGNSGGPIVEEKTGKLIGVAVAKLASVDTIGLLVPAEQVRQTLDGRIGYIDLTLKALQNDTVDLQVKAQIVDPSGKVGAVTLHVAPASGTALAPAADGSWSALPNSTKVELQRDPKYAMAAGEVQVPVSGQSGKARKVLIQTAHKDRSGKLVYSRPREFELPDKPGHVMAPGQIQRTIKEVRSKSFSQLGALIDPDKDCKLVKDDDRMKVKIDVPGNKIHTISPYVVKRFDKKKPLHNAPMVLAEVDTDIVAIVTVTGELTPGTTLPKDKQGNMIPFTFQGAGLVLYKDKENFVRIERSTRVDTEKLTSDHMFLFEVVKDGQQVPNHVYARVPEGDVLLILAKRKGKVRCLFSADGGKSVAMLQQFELDLPDKVKVGLIASNISAKPMTASFEDFALIDDQKLIDMLFGVTEMPSGANTENGQ
jgi:S1-C subfamily serine protease